MDVTHHYEHTTWEILALYADLIIFAQHVSQGLKGTIAHNKISASDIFTFNDDYEMISFETNERAITNDDETMESVPWTALCNEYKANDNDILMPTRLRARWNYPDGDFE